MQNESEIQQLKERILEFFEYDRDKAILIWKKHWRPQTASMVVGKVAGTMKPDGYIYICLNYKQYYLHRLVWLLEHGELERCVDHIDGDPRNNHISNLRAVTQRRNTQNQRKHRAGKLLGASWSKSTGKYRPVIRIGDQQITLGYFDDAMEAHLAYMKKYKEIASVI